MIMKIKKLLTLTCLTLFCLTAFSQTPMVQTVPVRARLWVQKALIFMRAFFILLCLQYEK